MGLNFDIDRIATALGAETTIHWTLAIAATAALWIATALDRRRLGAEFAVWHRFRLSTRCRLRRAVELGYRNCRYAAYIDCH
jgi:hypothetical protein